MRRYQLLFSFFILAFSVGTFAQHPSEHVIDKDKYGSDTQWSCKDKHFGYFYFDYSVPIPISKGVTNELLSHSLKFGYTYRFKIVDAIDFGTDIFYVNRVSGIATDSLGVFDPSGFYNKIKTYQNGFGVSPFMRINLSGSSYRNLGYFVDLGAYYNYFLWYGTQFVLKDQNIYQKARFKQSDFVSNTDYGAFARVSMNNISLVFKYSLSDWITSYSAQDLNYTRSPFLVGLQINLYAK